MAPVVADSRARVCGSFKTSFIVESSEGSASQAGQVIEPLGQRGRRGEQRFQVLLAAHDGFQRNRRSGIATLPATQVKQSVRYAIEIAEVAALALEVGTTNLDTNDTPVRHCSLRSVELEIPGNHRQMLAGQLKRRRALAGFQSI